MYETPPCPSCALRNIVCATCKSDKPKGPNGVWVGSWWYCGYDCAKTQKPPGEMCPDHREALKKIQASHPHLFPVSS